MHVRAAAPNPWAMRRRAFTCLIQRYQSSRPSLSWSQARSLRTTAAFPRPPDVAGERPGVDVLQQRHQLVASSRTPPVSATASGMPGESDEQVVLGARAGPIDGGCPVRPPPGPCG
jgi:hypothetical protein